MRHIVAQSTVSNPHVVDLCSVKPAELEGLWQRERQWWRDRLHWDVSDALDALRRVLERGSVRGKAVRVGAQTVGYALYMIKGHHGVISGLNVSPDWRDTGVREALLQETVNDMQRRDVRRIESQFIASDSAWLIPAFERQGFRTYWREFLRLELCQSPGTTHPEAMVQLDPWQWTHLHEAAPIMYVAYDGGVDAEVNELYRTADGCRVVLENIVSQRGNGIHVTEASAMARHRGQGIGFVVITEIAQRQGHLAQVAVLPAYQRRGIGQLLLRYSLSRLVGLQFDTLSLIVSRSNRRALRMYQAMGFQSVLAFPVFTWER